MPATPLSSECPRAAFPASRQHRAIFTRRFDVLRRYLSRLNLYVLLFQQSKGDETKLVQGLFPVAGEGVPGIFQIPLPVPLPGTNSEEIITPELGT